MLLWCKAVFSSLLQFSVSHDLLEIITIYLTQETFLIIINVEKFAASYFVEIVMHFKLYIYQKILNSIYLDLSNILIKLVNAFIK